jgi:hypothetical protein
MTNEEQEGLKPIHTYQSDAAEAIRNENITRTKIFLAEQKRQQELAEEERREREELARKKGSLLRNFRFIVVAVIFLLVGWYGVKYFLNNQESTPANLQPPPLTEEQRMLSYDSLIESQTEGLDKDSMLTAIQEARAKHTYGVSLFKIDLNMGSSIRKVSPEEFLFAISSEMPGLLVRSVEPPLILGQTENGAFMMFRINAYESAKGSLLESERIIQNDLSDFFEKDKQTNLSIADEVIENTDARVFKDNSGKTHFLYSFFDQSTLIFAENELAIKDAIERINDAKR